MKGPDFDVVHPEGHTYWERVGRAHLWGHIDEWKDGPYPIKDEKSGLWVFGLYKGGGFDRIENAIVLECPTGVGYTAQVGGISCMHPIVEGKIYPIDACLDDLEKFCQRTCDYKVWGGCYGGPLPEAMGTDPIWPILKNSIRDTVHGLEVEFDPRRAKYGMEAFVPVVASTHKGTRVYNGWLFLAGNCD